MLADKPILKAGRSYWKYKAKRNCWPYVKGVCMNPVEHPHGQFRCVLDLIVAHNKTCAHFHCQQVVVTTSTLVTRPPCAVTPRPARRSVSLPLVALVVSAVVSLLHFALSLVHSSSFPLARLQVLTRSSTRTCKRGVATCRAIVFSFARPVLRFASISWLPEMESSLARKTAALSLSRSRSHVSRDQRASSPSHACRHAHRD